MIVMVTLIVTTGGVVLLRPLTKRLVELLEVTTREKANPQVQGDSDVMRDLLETMNSRLALLEERQDFTERLLTEKSESRNR
jgi:hypothetical protein|tara:strand:+ start:216 stop:461 length:246 start_codon:yes stop_codon:yes gene_type:complete